MKACFAIFEIGNEKPIFLSSPFTYPNGIIYPRGMSLTTRLRRDIHPKNSTSIQYIISLRLSIHLMIATITHSSLLQLFTPEVENYALL